MSATVGDCARSIVIVAYGLLLPVCLSAAAVVVFSAVVLRRIKLNIIYIK